MSHEDRRDEDHRTGIEAFYRDLDRWAEEARALRRLALDAGLTETWKWKQPCYIHEGTNVVMVAPFAKYCTLSFFQGVLLEDEARRLVSPGKNSQSARQLRFTSVDDIDEQRDLIASYLREAMGHAAAGTRVEFAAKDKLELPQELLDGFAEVDGLEDAFKALTPGRQRGFVLHVAGAKKATTRRSRVDGHVDRILAGKGIHDCICGKSQKMPRCDGSHAR